MATTASITLTEAWITDPSDPTVSVHATYPDRSSTIQTNGEIRQYAGGRVRVITNRSESRTYPTLLQYITDADLAQLDVWRGRVLLLRDAEGRRVYGTYLEYESTDIYEPTGGTRHDVAFTFTRLTYNESV